MKKYMFVLIIFLLSFLVVACGTDDGEANESTKDEESEVNVNANEEKKEENQTEEQSSEGESAKEELPDDIPDDFPFPDDMGIVTVKSMDRPGGKNHVIAFETTVDAEELYNEMKTYLEENGCEGDEIGDQFACNGYSGNEYLGATKINIGDTVSTVTFIIPEKE